MSFEFHVSRDARQRYEFDEALFGLSGNVVFADYAAARRFAQAMNAQRDLAADPGRAVRAGDINAMGLVDEILHHVVELYRRQRNPAAMAGALAALDQALGSDALETALTVSWSASRLLPPSAASSHLPTISMARPAASRTARSRSRSC